MVMLLIQSSKAGKKQKIIFLWNIRGFSMKVRGQMQFEERNIGNSTNYQLPFSLTSAQYVCLLFVMIGSVFEITTGGKGSTPVCPVGHEDGDGGELPHGRDHQGHPRHGRRLPGGRWPDTGNRGVERAGSRREEGQVAVVGVLTIWFWKRWGAGLEAVLKRRGKTKKNNILFITDISHLWQYCWTFWPPICT